MANVSPCRGASSVLAVAAVLAACGHAGLSPPPTPGPTLVLEAPAPGTTVRLPVALVEVRGRAPSGELAGSDVVLAIDLSNTALHATGFDLDRDGVVGETPRWVEKPRRSTTGHVRFPRRPEGFTSDPDDAIVQAEFQAARELIAYLSRSHSRVGLLTYTATARQRAPVGSHDEAIEALDGIRVVVDKTGTRVAEALREAGEMLRAAPDERRPRRRGAILLFHDGKPSSSFAKWDEARSALRRARRLYREGVRVFVLAFGNAAQEDVTHMLPDIAAATGGRVVSVGEDTDLIAELTRNQFSPSAVEILNETTGAAGRAVRLFPDGSFDGFAPLTPGRNALRVSVRGTDGRVLNARRVVLYRRPENETDEDLRNAAKLLVELRHRRLETELAKLKPRPGGERSLEIETESDPLDSPEHEEPR